MNTAVSARKPQPLLSPPALRWAGLAAVAGCAAACSTPLLLAALGGAALGGSAAATAVAAVRGARFELVAGVLAFVVVLGVMALKSRRRPANASAAADTPPALPAELPIVCNPTLFTKDERAEHIEQTKDLLV